MRRFQSGFHTNLVQFLLSDAVLGTGAHVVPRVVQVFEDGVDVAIAGFVDFWTVPSQQRQST